MSRFFVEEYVYEKITRKELPLLASLLPAETKDNPVIELVQHWAGSSYSGFSHHYQINICLNPETKEVFALVAHKDHFLDPNVHAHVWHKNTGRVGISFICMYDQKLYPVTEDMMKFAGEVSAIVCEKYNLLPDRDFRDHKYHADMDGYPGERWDNRLMLSNGETVYSRTLRYCKEEMKDKLITPKVKPPDNFKRTKTIFEDVFNEIWYSKSVLDLYNKGIIAGDVVNSRKYYYPDKNITRKDAFRLIFKAVMFISKYAQAMPKYSEQDLDYLVKTGLVAGDGNSNFNLDQELTRAQLCSLMSKIIKMLQNYIPDFVVKFPNEEPFLDVQPKHWCYNPIILCYQTSLMIGYKEMTGHYFKPDNKITRGEFSATLYKLLSYIRKNTTVKF